MELGRGEMGIKAGWFYGVYNKNLEIVFSKPICSKLKISKNVVIYECLQTIKIKLIKTTF